LAKLQDHHSLVRVNGKTFLSCENKTQLVEFFVDGWSKSKPRFKLEGKLIFFPSQKLMSLDHCQQCCFLVKEDHPGFHQEKADTKMFLRGKDAVDNGFQSIVIRSSDTDVEVLACFFFKPSCIQAFHCLWND
jgi:hypothetical protein